MNQCDIVLYQSQDIERILNPCKYLENNDIIDIDISSYSLPWITYNSVFYVIHTVYFFIFRTLNNKIH
jgi:hypothetical protein